MSKITHETCILSLLWGGGGGVSSLPIECGLLINFANSKDPDLAGQHVWHNLDPICLTLGT